MRGGVEYIFLKSISFLGPPSEAFGAEILALKFLVPPFYGPHHFWRLCRNYFLCHPLSEIFPIFLLTPPFTPPSTPHIRQDRFQFECNGSNSNEPDSMNTCCEMKRELARSHATRQSIGHIHNKQFPLFGEPAYSTDQESFEKSKNEGKLHFSQAYLANICQVTVSMSSSRKFDTHSYQTR